MVGTSGGLEVIDDYWLFTVTEPIAVNPHPAVRASSTSILDYLKRSFIGMYHMGLIEVFMEFLIQDGKMNF